LENSEWKVRKLLSKGFVLLQTDFPVDGYDDDGDYNECEKYDEFCDEVCEWSSKVEWDADDAGVVHGKT